MPGWLYVGVIFHFKKETSEVWSDSQLSSDGRGNEMSDMIML